MRHFVLYLSYPESDLLLLRCVSCAEYMDFLIGRLTVGCWPSKHVVEASCVAHRSGCWQRSQSWFVMPIFDIRMCFIEVRLCSVCAAILRSCSWGSSPCGPFLHGTLRFPFLHRCRSLVFSLTFQSGRHARRELVRQRLLRGEICLIQTIGGGWASLRRTRQALSCARRLHYVALLLGDVEIARKSLVFMAWCNMWEGHFGKASRILEHQKQSAEARGDELQFRRCQCALKYLGYYSTQPRQLRCSDAEFEEAWREATEALSSLHS